MVISEVRSLTVQDRMSLKSNLINSSQFERLAIALSLVKSCRGDLLVLMNNAIHSIGSGRPVFTCWYQNLFLRMKWVDKKGFL
ncbi:MAG: hypothetical protein RLP02_01105 [Coleofasciculus sp. C2-GNP5-27]